MAQLMTQREQRDAAKDGKLLAWQCAKCGLKLGCCEGEDCQPR